MKEAEGSPTPPLAHPLLDKDKSKEDSDFSKSQTSWGRVCGGILRSLWFFFFPWFELWKAIILRAAPYLFRALLY